MAENLAASPTRAVNNYRAVVSNRQTEAPASIIIIIIFLFLLFIVIVNTLNT